MSNPYSSSGHSFTPPTDSISFSPASAARTDQDQIDALNAIPINREEISPSRRAILKSTEMMLASLLDGEEREALARILCEQLPPSEAPQYVDDFRVPSFKDNDFVFDEFGVQVFEKVLERRGDQYVEVDKPMRWTKTRMFKPGRREPNASYPTLKTIDGKDLIPLNPAEQAQTYASMFYGTVYRWLDGKWDVEHLESAANEEAQKRLQQIVGNGPDNDARIWEIRSTNGNMNVEFGAMLDVYRRYNGGEVSPMEMRRFKDQIKFMRLNRAETQARLSYAIGKLEEQEQGGPEGLWNTMLQFMHRELHYTREQIMSVGIGLQYMKKGSYLTFKHRGIELVGPLGGISVRPDGTGVSYGTDGQEVLYSKSELERMRDNGQTRYQLGKLKTRAYVTELADKIKTYEYNFSSADVAEIINIATGLSVMLDRYADKPNRREYQNLMYILRKLKVVADASRMSGGITPGKDGGIDLDQFSQAQRAIIERSASAGQAGPNYAPTINSTAEAKTGWPEFAAIIDSAAIVHDKWSLQNKRLDYPSNGAIDFGV